MKELFVPHKQALELKELGFDEPCLGRRLVITEWEKPTGEVVLQIGLKVEDYSKNQCAAPTFSQAFRFFREKYDLDHYTDRNDDIMIEHVKSKGLKNLPKYTCGYSDGSSHPIKSCDSYEEAELACLNKLIEIVKKSIQICK